MISSIFSFFYGSGIILLLNFTYIMPIINIFLNKILLHKKFILLNVINIELFIFCIILKYYIKINEINFIIFYLFFIINIFEFLHFIFFNKKNIKYYKIYLFLCFFIIFLLIFLLIFNVNIFNSIIFLFDILIFTIKMLIIYINLLFLICYSIKKYCVKNK